MDSGGVIPERMDEDIFRQSDSLLRAGRIKEAAALLRKAAAEGIDVETGFLNLGRIWRALGSREGASRAYRKSAGHNCSAALDAFSMLLCDRRFTEAFELAETLLDSLPGGGAAAHLFLWPWWRSIQRGVLQMEFCKGELKALDAARKDERFRPWYSYCRAILMSTSAKSEAALAEQDALLPSFSSSRYVWMRQAFVLIRQSLGDLDGVVRECKAILAPLPLNWWARCRLAETYLVQGHTSKGMREFERAEATGYALAKREALTWHGEALLWIGRYRKALRKLDEAVSFGATTFVHGWRGAALTLLGRHPEAVKALDLALELDPRDREALVWRGEAKRMMGLHQDALQDLTAVVKLDPGYAWAYFNRALARYELGDRAGMREDYGMIPAEMIQSFYTRPRRAGPCLPEPRKMRDILQEGLKLARGIRRPEKYLQQIWMHDIR